MSVLANNQISRDRILASIRAHLNAHDGHEIGIEVVEEVFTPNGPSDSGLSKVELFKKNLEAVNGRCVIALSELEIVHALTEIVDSLKRRKLNWGRIAVSNANGLLRLMRLVPVELEEIKSTPSAEELFHFDVGLTTAQAGIAETGTLVLDSSQERNRLVSLVPPVHIAVVNASDIYLTLGETLSLLSNKVRIISPTVTFITGPSRTADIELTLTVGVHGPRELYVIINNGSPLVAS